MAMFKRYFQCFFILFIFTSCSDGAEYSLLSYVKSMYSTLGECGHYGYYTCLKIKGLKFLKNALKDSEIKVSNGIFFQKDSIDVERSLNRSEDVVTDENVDNLLIDRAKKFMSSYSMKINLQDFASQNEVTGRDRRNDFFKKGNGQVLVLAGMMAGVMGAIVLSGISLITGKALLVSNIALTLGIILGLCKLMESKKKGGVMYEVVKPYKQIHESDYSDGHEIFGVHGGGLSGAPVQFAGNIIGTGGSNYGRSLDASDSHYIVYSSHIEDATPVPQNTLTPSL